MEGVKVAWLLAAICIQQVLSAAAQDLVLKQSFGVDGRISADRGALPNWKLSGENFFPQLLSDRIVLTPPAPAHARGALWNAEANTDTQWAADVKFRASGQDRGTGNFQIWYAKDGRSVVGTHSIFTATKFEGLVLTIDQHGEKGGMLRGFLNDGNTNYRNHQMVDSLAFGFCTFAYRNLGRYSKIGITHTTYDLKVTIDDQPCFSTQKVSLPSGYFFGLTAATSDNPDSFEVASFLVQSLKTSSPPKQARRDDAPPPKSGEHHLPNAPEQLPDNDASGIKQQQDQFADLHNRMQALSHQVNNMFAEFEQLSQQIRAQHEEVLARVPQSTANEISALRRRLDSMDNVLQALDRRSINPKDYSTHFDDLHKAVKDVKGGLSVDLPDALHQVVRGHGTGLTTIIIIVIAIQAVVGGLYYLYRRRRDSAPKKYI